LAAGAAAGAIGLIQALSSCCPVLRHGCGSLIAVDSQLRVLHVVYSLHHGGAERAATNILTGLHELDADARCAVFSPPADTEFEAELREKHVPLVHFGKRKGFSGGVYQQLARLISGFKPHVLHTHLGVLRYALPPALWLRVPVLVHTLHARAYTEGVGLERWLRRQTFDKRVVPVAVARIIADTACELYGLASCRVIYNGIPTARFLRPAGAKKQARQQLGIPDEDVVFICVARLHPVKNHQLLLQAFQQVAATSARAWLLVVGGGPLLQELSARAQDPAFGGRLRVLGPQESIIELLWAADVAVLASLTEGLPVALTEAMAAGNAVICTDIGGMPELVLHDATGLVVPSGDSQALAAAMLKLAADAELRRRMAAAGLKRAVEQFDYLATSRQYLRLYESLLAERKRRAQP